MTIDQEARWWTIQEGDDQLFQIVIATLTAPANSFLMGVAGGRRIGCGRIKQSGLLIHHARDLAPAPTH